MYVCTLKVLLGGILLTMAFTAIWCVAIISNQKKEREKREKLLENFSGGVFIDGKSDTKEEEKLKKQLIAAKKQVAEIEKQLATLYER